MGEQRRGEVRRQAGPGRAGSRRGRGSEKVEQPNDEGGVGGGSAIDGEDKGREAEERQEGGRKEAVRALLPVSPGTCWVLLGKSLSLSGRHPPLENSRLDQMISRAPPSEVLEGSKLASKRGDGWE